MGQIMDKKRRAFISCGAFFLSSVFVQFGLPSLSTAACRLVFPMPKRRPDAASPPKCAPKVALVIDDIGNSIHIARAFLCLNLPITFSILPLRPFSKELVDEIAAKGHEILLHQPMEPMSPYIDPGPGAVYTDFTAIQIREIVRKNIQQVEGAVGVNNHMGSKFTTHSAKMKEALTVIKGEGLFFIDSLTSHRSVAYRTAKRLHMRADHRSVFLDYEIGVDTTVRQMTRLVCLAIRRGKAIGIGHPFPSTLEGIKRFLGSRRKLLEKVEFVPVSRLVCA